MYPLTMLREDLNITRHGRLALSLCSETELLPISHQQQDEYLPSIVTVAPPPKQTASLTIVDELSSDRTGIPDPRIDPLAEGRRRKNGHYHLSNRRLHQLVVRKSRGLPNGWNELPSQVRHASHCWVEDYVAPICNESLQEKYWVGRNDSEEATTSHQLLAYPTLWEVLVSSEVDRQHAMLTRSPRRAEGPNSSTSYEQRLTTSKEDISTSPSGQSSQPLIGVASHPKVASTTASPSATTPPQIDQYLSKLLRCASSGEETLLEAAEMVKKQRGNNETALSAYTIRAFHALSPSPASQATSAEHHALYFPRKGPARSLGVLHKDGKHKSDGSQVHLTPEEMAELSEMFSGGPSGFSTHLELPAPSLHLHRTESPQYAQEAEKAIVVSPRLDEPAPSLANTVRDLINAPRPFVDYRPLAARISPVFAQRLQRMLYLKRRDVCLALDSHVRALKMESNQEVFGVSSCDLTPLGVLGTPGSVEFILRQEIVKVAMLHGIHRDAVVMSSLADTASHKPLKVPLAMHVGYFAEDPLTQSDNQNIPPAVTKQFSAILTSRVQGKVQALYSDCCRGLRASRLHRANSTFSCVVFAALCRRLYRRMFVHFSSADIDDLIAAEMATLLDNNSSSTAASKDLRNVEVTSRQFAKWMSLLMLAWCERGTVAECLQQIQTVGCIWRQEVLFVKMGDGAEVRATTMFPPTSRVPRVSSPAPPSLEALLQFTTLEVQRMLELRFRGGVEPQPPCLKSSDELIPSGGDDCGCCVRLHFDGEEEEAEGTALGGAEDCIPGQGGGIALTSANLPPLCTTLEGPLFPTIQHSVSPLSIRRMLVPPASHSDRMMTQWLLKRLPPLEAIPAENPPVASSHPHVDGRDVDPPSTPPPNQRRTISTPLVESIQQRSLHYARFSRSALDARGTYKIAL